MYQRLQQQRIGENTLACRRAHIRPSQSYPKAVSSRPALRLECVLQSTHGRNVPSSQREHASFVGNVTEQFIFQQPVASRVYSEMHSCGMSFITCTMSSWHCGTGTSMICITFQDFLLELQKACPRSALPCNHPRSARISHAPRALRRHVRRSLGSG